VCLKKSTIKCAEKWKRLGIHDVDTYIVCSAVLVLQLLIQVSEAGSLRHNLTYVLCRAKLMVTCIFSQTGIMIIRRYMGLISFVNKEVLNKP
jgi:hypothetical protein